MELYFKRSLVVMGQLAKDAARTPPSEDQPPFEYIDRSLTILGRTFDTQNQRIRQESLSQREFIASQFREVEKRIDGRFKEVDERFKEVDERFNQVDERFNQVDERFEKMEQKMDRRFEEVNSQFQDLKTRFENAAAITRNGRLRRMHQPINLIKVLKPGRDHHTFVWASHPQVPKHMKNTYTLGQEAKGKFDGPSWNGHSEVQMTRAMHKARDTIVELAKFYGISIRTDEESESDATEVMLSSGSVDQYMEALLDEWGMDWHKLLKLGTQLLQPQTQQAGAKRAGDASSRGEEKKIRGGREEEVDYSRAESI